MSPADLFRSLLGVMLALAFVLALAFGFIWFLKWLQDRQAGRVPGAVGEAADELRFLRALPLGPRERAVLVEVRGERLLLGVAAGGVTLLARWPQATREATGIGHSAEVRQ